MLHYGFFNSSSGDRKYSAEDFGRIFDGIIVDGVFQSVGQHFAVTAAGGLNVSVGTGRAWFDHTYTYNDSAIVLTHDINNTLLDRIDAVILEVNHDVNTRANSIKVLKGPTTSTTRPSMTNTETVKQFPLAYVTVKKDNSTTITQGDITNMVGTSSVPYVTAPLEKINADQLIAQWVAQFNEFMTASDNTFDSSMTEWATEFTTWFEDLQPIFEEDDYQAILLRVQSVAAVRTATFTANGWTETSSGSGIYTQSVTVTGMSPDYNPILVGMLTANTVADANAYNKAFAWLSAGRGVTTTNTVTMYCYGGHPETSITVGFKGE